MTYTDSMNRRADQPGTIPGDLDKLENLDNWEIADGEIDPRGYDLVGRDLERGVVGENIGTIENLLASPSTQQAHFAIVDTGGWFSGKRFLVPLNQIQFRDGKAYGPFTKEHFQNAPEWHEGDRDYDRYYSYWNLLDAAPAASGTVEHSAAMKEGEEVVIPVVEEELHVGKRQVERGVRISTRVTERPVEEAVRLREEQVHVERHPVDRPLADADDAFREDSVEVTAVAEEPVVSKQARVVEEVVVGKEATEHTQIVHDTVRRTDVDIDEDDETSLETPRHAGRA